MTGTYNFRVRNRETTPNDVYNPVLAATDRESARQLIQKSRRSQGWTSEAIEIFLVSRSRATTAGNLGQSNLSAFSLSTAAQYTGFRPDGSWRLVMRPNNEYLTYHDKETPSHTCDRLRDVGRPILWFSPEKPFAM